MKNRLIPKSPVPGQLQVPERGAMTTLLVTLAVMTTFAFVGAADVWRAASADRIKATYLYQFSKYVQWSADRASTQQSGRLVIGVLGENRFGEAIDYFKQNPLPNQRVDFRDIHADDDWHDVHIVFVSSSEADNIAEILDRLEGNGILTVGESAGFAEKGGIVEFVFDANNIRFNINISAARREGLMISSKLLRIAAKIIDK